TAATGEVRHFETPPLEVGHYYHYDVTVRHGGKEFTRRVHLKHGGDNTFDFRSDPTPVKRGAKVARARVDSKPGKVQGTGELASPGATTTVSGNQLPPPPEPFQGKIGRNVAQSTPWWPPRVVPPKGAPNVLLIMTDDTGFGVSSTFGGVIPSPTLDRVAKNG